ncbi:cilia- and flagella-associated protein 65 [Conger conger]|uniref:cilia- and flagella-associated protein 65 n=1 Tax=Conger conger TaxID=82655 RepID=UPI002A5AB033|nr:cilia- and flagella-associated protein 65 [Conger conger]
MLAENPVNPLTSDLHQRSRCTKNGQGAVSRRSGTLQRVGTSKRTRYLGVETLAELVWDSWELGREYTKSLPLKNVHTKLHKLSFRAPASRVFSTLFPHTMVLSPGTTSTLPITFRPLERHEHSDSIEFHSSLGTFQVSLRATLPQHALVAPESVLLAPCGVLDSSQASFLLHNTSKLQTHFLWKVSEPFQLSPETGVLGPGEECHMTVMFRPQGALVFQQAAACVFGEQGECQCSVLLQGLAKYPHLQLCGVEQEDGCNVLEFGSVPISQSLERHFYILNPSSVSASFRLAGVGRVPLEGSVFGCEAREGRLSPGDRVKVSVCFSPLRPDCSSVEYLCLTCHGAPSTALLKLHGNSTGPEVTLRAAVLDFGCVSPGGEAWRTVEMANSAAAEGHFQFDTDASGHSVFTVDPPCGTLPGDSRLTLRVRFRPQRPIAHHRRAPCLLLHRDPLFLDLIGTCHSEELKPAILSSEHLKLYDLHLARGLTCYPPDILSAMLAAGSLQLDQEGALLLPEVSARPPVESGDMTERNLVEEYFQGGADSAGVGAHVTVAPAELLFPDGPRSLPLSITNHTKGRLSLAWTSNPDSPFSVSPASCDLPPLKSTAFRVTYAPLQRNTLHGAQLECFAWYTVLRDHRLVEEHTVCPPWCVTVRVSGHSFQPGCEHFTPRFSLQRPLVVFPALAEVCYRTALLQNVGDLPLAFSLGSEGSPSVSVHPSIGLVQPGALQVLTLRGVPTEDQTPTLSISMQINATPKYTQALTVLYVVEKPRVSLEGDGVLFFKPTALGYTSLRSHTLKNTSRLPLHFHWRIPSPDARVLSVQPESGVLQPSEAQVLKWSFAPLAEMQYNLRPCLTFWPTQVPGSKKSRLFLQVVGLASTGSLQAEQAVTDLGQLLAGSCQSCDLPLVNNGPCPLSFSLEVKQCIVGPGQEDSGREALALQLDSPRGTVPARSRMVLRSRVRLAHRAQYCWTISYRILSSSGSELAGPQYLCEVKAEGVFPVLQVTDVRGSGGVEGLSKLQLWGLFSLDPLNAYLRRDPTPPELTYRVPTRHSLQGSPSFFTPVLLDCNFSAAPLGSEPSSVLLMLENPGSIPVDWCFLFPEDQQLELECWAESVEFSPTELLHMKVQEQRLFSVSPRSGTLQPGQQRAVQLTHRHDFAGTDLLPVLLKLSHGREILLNFVGVTVERDMPYVHFSSSQHTFTPVAIGGFSPPRQVYELYNGGAVPVRYHIDTAPLEQLTEDHFGHPVLQCLTPRGEVQPGHTAGLEWIFSPLEVKTYTVDVPVHVLDGDSVLVRFEGRGWDSRGAGEARGGPPSLPSTQRVALPGQLVFLSEEWVSLGDIPVCSRSTRILFLTNVSRTERVLYSWNLPRHRHQQVCVVPDSGLLAAGQSALCILTLQVSGSPSFYLLDLICQVTTERAMAQYEEELQRWEQERERQRNEFTFTEQGIEPPSHCLLDNHTQECVTPTQRAGSMMRKYKTLPPICSSSDVLGVMEVRPSREEKRAQRKAAEVWRRPEQPRPFLVHLGVTARSHSSPELQSCSLSRLNTHYIHRTQNPKLPSLPDSGDRSLFSHGAEREIITHAVSTLLRSLIDDPQFQQSLVGSSADPVPYFSQIRSPQPQSVSSAEGPSLDLSPESQLHRNTASESPLHHSTQESETHQSTLQESQIDQDPLNESQIHQDPLNESQLQQNTLLESLLQQDTLCESQPPQDTQLQEDGVSESELSNESVGESELELPLQESIRGLPEFADLVEDVLLNTLQNLMTEAFLGEVLLTARPRTIALPPSASRKSPRCSSQKPSAGTADNSREVI